MPLIKIWVYEGILASSVAGMIDVFTAANCIAGGRRTSGKPAPLRWRIESIDGREVRTASGQRIDVDGPISTRSPADAVVVPGPFVPDVEGFLNRKELVTPLIEALRRQHQRGVLLASYCTGSFLLAEAGLLDGSVATTHWARGKTFAQRYPNVDLRINDIITEQDDIICSGAVTSALNLALRIVQKLVGAEVAAETGKLMLIDGNRVAQSSYASMSENHHSDALVLRAQRWMERSLQRGFSLGELARQLAVSERTLNRRFKRAMGKTPLHYLQSLRIDVAKRLLETKDLTMDAVSQRVGYGDLSTFRRLFKRETGLSPRDYQRRFSRRHRHRVAVAA
ncbi:helix-turn-helix domain-containing protein [Bradyrhizobium frederickii]|uniref:Helix-turn-helix domain-containing protein n=2 Tax=Bradyrhizobium frederickii TaxID=2560054 RepID=A0A4Y9NZN3_9BRAD|nr:helix-turn-helix domain-containing protein [Bradyrhizobium frederickii]